MTSLYNRIIYFCYQPSVGENYKKKINAENHKAVEVKKNLIVWPDNISALTCSPENLHKLKDSLSTKSITVVDQIKNKGRLTAITGHVNRSGKNFLNGKTPFLEKPQFPDMTTIYHSPTNSKTTVHTIGPKRYLSSKNLNNKVVWSSSIGLVAPVFSYLGFEVQGVGVPDKKTNDNILTILTFIS